MSTLAKEQTCLLELIKAALFELTPVLPEHVDWEKVFELAKAQCIVPLLASFVPTEHRNEWSVQSCLNKAQFIKIMYEQNSLVNLLKNNAIRFVILKGTSAAIYYPVPHLRTFGDIDIYVSKDSFDKTKALLKENGYNLLDNNERHFEFEKNGEVVELHTKFSSEFYNDIEHVVINGLNKAIDYKIVNYSFPCLPVYENGLVLLGHIMQHLKTSGIGLRQIIDWMMFVNKELDDDSWNNSFCLIASEAGLEKLAITVTYMCKKWLGLPNKITWCNNADEEVADQLLIRVFDDGNLGHDRTPSECVKYSIKKDGFFKYLQLAGMNNWPLAQKHSIFRPFAWVYQLCRYAFMGISGLLTGKKMFKKTNSNMSIEELWERLE